MDKINIEGVILTPLNKIRHPKGDIFHGIKMAIARSSSDMVNCLPIVTDRLVTDGH